MFERELKIYRFLHGYEQKLLADLPAAEMARPAFPGGNPPSWIVGHLAVVADFALMLLGQATLCPKTWMVLFGPGSSPEQHLGRHPGKDELVDALDRGHAAVFAAVPQADPKLLEQPSPFEPLRDPLPTAADLLAHLLTSHEAAHASQLSACRRRQGHGPLF